MLLRLLPVAPMEDAAPINSEQTPDLQLGVDEQKTPNLPDSNVTIAYLPALKATPLAPLTPSLELLGKPKRKRLKPPKFDFSSSDSEKKPSLSADQAVDDPSKPSLSLLKKKRALKIFRAPVQDSETMTRAREVQSTLGTEHPIFIKQMLKSHVTICFWMGIPIPFARSNLPNHDAMVIAEDENGRQTNLKYIAHKFGLSAGWRNFAIKHKLREGDVLIFQLVESCKFKVHVVRAPEPKEGEDADNAIKVDENAEDITPVSSYAAMVKKYKKPKEIKCSGSGSGSLPLTKVKRKYTRTKPPAQLSNHYTDPSIIISQFHGGLPEPNASLKDIKTFTDFHIMVDKRCIDMELSEEIRTGYYNLCIEKNEILHDGIREGLYYKLVAGVIGETVNIANMIRNCKLTTRKEDFDAWDSSLESFGLMGMKVGFLRDRVRELANHVVECEDAKRYVEAKEEQRRNANEIRVLEAKLVELYESSKKINEVVDGLKEKAERFEVEFKKKVDAPW